MSGEVILAVAIPIVALIILVGIISVIMRRYHRKRMEKLAASLGKQVFCRFEIRKRPILKRIHMFRGKS